MEGQPDHGPLIGVDLTVAAVLHLMAVNLPFLEFGIFECVYLVRGQFAVARLFEFMAACLRTTERDGLFLTDWTHRHRQPPSGFMVIADDWRDKLSGRVYVTEQRSRHTASALPAPKSADMPRGAQLGFQYSILLLVVVAT